MKEIFCPITMFALNQKIYSVDTEREDVTVELGETTVDNLPEILLEFCDKEEINKIHLVGNNEYVKLVAQDITIYHETKYEKKKEIEIEVN